MKRLIKSSLLIAASVMSLLSSAENFGIQASFVNSKETNDKIINGVQVGPVSESPIIKNFDLQYGVLYQFLTNEGPGDFSGTNTYTGHFLEVPLRLKADFPMNSAIKLFAFAGPNLSFGLAEQTVNVTTIGSSVITSTYNRYEIDADDDDIYDISRFNLQMGVGGGIQFEHVQLKVGYDWGINDLNKREDVTFNRNQLNASVCFFF